MRMKVWTATRDTAVAGVEVAARVVRKIPEVKAALTWPWRWRIFVGSLLTKPMRMRYVTFAWTGVLLDGILKRAKVVRLAAAAVTFAGNPAVIRETVARDEFTVQATLTFDARAAVWKAVVNRVARVAFQKPDASWTLKKHWYGPVTFAAMRVIGKLAVTLEVVLMMLEMVALVTTMPVALKLQDRGSKKG